MPEKKVSINEVQVGMELARAVCDPQGRVIIPEGGRINPMAIKRLPKWNITHIFVRVSEEEAGEAEQGKDVADSDEPKETDTVFISRVELAVEERFSSIERTHFNNEFKKMTIKNLIEKGRGVVPDL